MAGLAPPRTVGSMRTTITTPSNLLERLTGDEARDLRRLGDVVRVAAGTTIQPQGACSRWFHCVLAGTVAISDGGPPEVGGPGTCFPEEALRGDIVPAAASVVAVTEVTVLAMGLREFHGALDTIPGFAAAMREVVR